MPKASFSTTSIVQQSPPPNTPSGTPNILKRNQACHQCRRRKLKCDARRPCATCIRSHANTRATSGAASVPPEPECTYDDIPEPRQQGHDAPKNRYKRLESRINELENMLWQKTSPEASKQQPQNIVPPQPGEKVDHEPVGSFDFHPEVASQPYTSSHTPSTAATPHSFGFMDYKSPDYTPVNLASHPASSYDPLMSEQDSGHPSPPTVAGLERASSEQNIDIYQELFWPSWPAQLPGPEMLMHLVNVFFTSLPHANSILHRPSFVAALSLPCTDPNFPASSLIHAICAVASIFTTAIAPLPIPRIIGQADEMFNRRHESRDDSFGEMHAKYAKEAQNEAALLGEGLFAGTQSVVILSWYYFYHARWVDVWISTGDALRYCTPLMLNICPPQIPLTRSWKPERPILESSRSVVEDETRRNTFWLAYAMDRFHSSGTDFAMTLDDEDITQVLPCTSGAFEAGTSVSIERRQRLNTPHMLTTHPPEQTDSFVLYIKAAALLSKVKIFNQRFRAKYQSGGLDPRETPAFKALDGAIGTFHAAFPQEFRDPLANGTVDSHLYVAHLVPHAAVLLLHDPHADFGKRDRSYEKLTAAAHAVLDLVYLVCATTYDIALLDPMAMWCWHWAARELVRELQHMQRTGQTGQVAVLRSEIEVIRLALVRLGKRIPLGHRQRVVLDDLLAQEVSAHAQPYTTSGLEEADPGSLEHLMYEGMHRLR